MMIRLSEEQRRIVSCYSDAKEEMIAELQKAIPFIEDADLREESEDLLVQIEKMTQDEFTEEFCNGMIDVIEEVT